MKKVAISILGTTMDRRGKGDKRWDKWRPTLSMCQHDDLLIDRLELLFDHHAQHLANQVTDDIARVSPATQVVHHCVDFVDPWDFETVYSDLLDFARGYSFDTGSEKYLVHITTGTHVAQICLYLLTEAGYLPGKLQGRPVSVNCATLKGENAMSALFGDKKGAFTGAAADRAGLLMEADGGLLFLDEIGELGLDEQAMLLKAIEYKRFMPFGADRETSSNFQVIAGTNRDLARLTGEGLFREDLLARIDLWTYRLPSLQERLEDLAPNIDYELEAFSRKAGELVSFNKAAREKYLRFGMSPAASWSANFRDLNASITRMATLAEAGRKLFNVSRLEKKSQNDSHRVKQLLDKYGIRFEH